MSNVQSGLTGLAARLRYEFDRSFAEPPSPAPPPAIDLLEITVAAERYALRLGDIAGLYADQPITRLPDRVPALLGIAAPHGDSLPIYDLAVLLGGEPAAAPRWLAVAAAKPAALAFSTLHGVRRVQHDALVPHDAPRDGRGHVRELAHTADSTMPVVDLGALLAAIARLSTAQSGEERG